MGAAIRPRPASNPPRSSRKRPTSVASPNNHAKRTPTANPCAELNQPAHSSTSHRSEITPPITPPLIAPAFPQSTTVWTTNYGMSSPRKRSFRAGQDKQRASMVKVSIHATPCHPPARQTRCHRSKLHTADGSGPPHNAGGGGSHQEDYEKPTPKPASKATLHNQSRLKGLTPRQPRLPFPFFLGFTSLTPTSNIF